jgi:hypothetical protein
MDISTISPAAVMQDPHIVNLEFKVPESLIIPTTALEPYQSPLNEDNLRAHTLEVSSMIIIAPSYLLVSSLVFLLADTNTLTQPVPFCYSFCLF